MVRLRCAQQRTPYRSCVRGSATTTKDNNVAKKSDRSDPKSNKSLAIRVVLKKMPNAKASDIAEAVKKQYGHNVGTNIVYMVKTKLNMSAGRKSTGKPKTKTPMTSAALWIDAIKSARDLIRATGSAENATALLKALGDL